MPKLFHSVKAIYYPEVLHPLDAISRQTSTESRKAWQGRESCTSLPGLSETYQHTITHQRKQQSWTRWITYRVFDGVRKGKAKGYHNATCTSRDLHTPISYKAIFHEENNYWNSPVLCCNSHGTYFIGFINSWNLQSKTNIGIQANERKQTLSYCFVQPLWPTDRNIWSAPGQFHCKCWPFSIRCPAKFSLHWHS